MSTSPVTGSRPIYPDPVSRIIAGRAGGRRLSTPPGDATRPTSDRVREAFFSAVAAWNGSSDQPVADQLAGQSMLDLFAGSGAVGLEAASRGAARVVAVERNPRTAALIRANARSCRLDAQTTAICVGVERFLSGGRPGEPFDLIFCDPPYALDAAELDSLIATAVRDFLAHDGLIAVERSSRGRAPVFGARMDSWANRYGETVVYFAQPSREDM